jgi:hypothetical protein
VNWHLIESLVCRNVNFCTGDDILKYERGRCERCGADWHDVADCPIPPGLTPEESKRTSAMGGCCGPPKAV